jgi:hypothetical protein
MERELRKGLCNPIMVPSLFTCIISLVVSDPLSTPEGVIQISPFLSLIEIFPPEVVVIPRLYILP